MQSREYILPNVQGTESFTTTARMTIEYGSRSRSEDESEYGAISREIQNELSMAKRASDNIRDVNDELFDELEVFQEKLLRHSKRQDRVSVNSFPSHEMQ